MDKVWFKLRQSDYPPPPDAAILQGCTGREAPVCLGHIIKDLKNFDFAMNTDSIEPLPRNVRVYLTRKTDFRWDDKISKENSVDLGASAPIAAAAGITVGGDIKLAFSRSVESHEEYERLDTYIMQPTQAYIQDCLDEEPFLSYIRGKKIWTLFMVTGLCIARKGTRSAADSSGVTLGTGVHSGVAAVADARAEFKNVHESSRKTGGTHTDDFVWAVRLARIHKGIFQSDWSVSTHTKKATFAARKDEVDVAAVLRDEGVTNFTVVEDEEMNEAFII